MLYIYLSTVMCYFYFVMVQALLAEIASKREHMNKSINR